jgi:hypothetical protein
MTQVVHPSLRLSTSGAVALLDTVDRGYRVCELPRGTVRWNLSDERNLAHLALSASGAAVAWLGDDQSAKILTDAGRKTLSLPTTPDRIRAIAIGDTGDRIAALIAPGARDAADGGEARLVIVPGLMGDETLAGADIPVYDRGFILANGDCTLIAVESSSSFGERGFGGAYALDGDVLRPLWTGQTASVPHGALALYGDWLFAATADGLAGWRLSGETVSLPGTTREQVIFSPNGRHLLAYRAEEVTEVTSARILFRLIDLDSLQEVRQANHPIENRQDAQFALDAALGLFDVRATRSGDLSIEQLGWEGS